MSQIENSTTGMETLVDSDGGDALWIPGLWPRMTAERVGHQRAPALAEAPNKKRGPTQSSSLRTLIASAK